MNPVTLQRIVPPRGVETAELYARHEPPGVAPRTALTIPPGTALDLDCYFNAFDEQAWLRHTRCRSLTLALELAGLGRVEIWRHSPHAPPALIAEAEAAAGRVTLDVPPPPHPRAAGRLAARIRVPAGASAAARLESGAWLARAEPDPISLVPVICTMDREEHLARLLAALARDAAALAATAAIVVVNHGAPNLAGRLLIPAALRRKLRLFEQRNVGGAGGFSRGMLEARAAGATHLLLMDDDVELEPEAVLRAHRFLALCRAPTVLAGHMLDVFRPTHLYEAGAQLIDRKLAFAPLHGGAELSRPGALDRFLLDTPMHYNGWWFMALPASLLDDAGWPMPCFIRGDDVEFGRRLHDRGTKFVAVLGVGIWHEPFYAKLGSWHVYYEMRNMAVLAACHLPDASRRIATVLLTWLVAELLMYRYQRAALILRAGRDFLAGPAIFAEPPRALHASLAAIRARYPAETASREHVVPIRPPVGGPRGRAAFLAGVLRALLAEGLRPDGTRRVIAVEPRDHLWFRVRGADAVIAREAWEDEWPLYRRSRATFRHLFRETIKLAWQLRRLPRVVAAWRAAHAGFTTEAAWRAYLQKHAGLTEANAIDRAA